MRPDMPMDREIACRNSRQQANRNDENHLVHEALQPSHSLLRVYLCVDVKASWRALL